MIEIRNCSSSQFMRIIEGRKIICFCAGEIFKTFCKDYSVVSQIEYIVDGFKAGTAIGIGGRDIPIIAIEQISSISEGTILVLTSVKVADEIIPQLDQNKIFEGRILYVPEMFETEESGFVWETNFVPRIPKIIHYCWFGGNSMPKCFIDNIDTWKKFCPDYEIKQWNEINYDITKNKYMLQAYDKKKWGFVPDYARLDIVASQGGIYLDTDVKMLKSFDSLLQFGLFCGFESTKRVNFGQGFGAIKGHYVIEEMRQEYEDLEFINPDGTMNIEPSPVYQTRTLRKHGLLVNGRLQQLDDMIIFPSEYFSPLNEFGYGLPTVNSFSIHQYDGSWYDETQRKIKERIIRNYQYVASRIEGRGETLK